MHTAAAVRFACVGVIAGIAIASIFFDVPAAAYVISVLGCGVIAAIVAVWYPRTWLIGIAAAAVSFSWALVSHNSYQARVTDADGLTATRGIVNYVDLYPSRQRLIVRVDRLALVDHVDEAEQNGADLSQPLTVYIYARRYPVFHVGDVLSFECRLQAVEPDPEVRFDRFAERRRVSHICLYPRLQAVGHEDSLRARIFAVREYARLALVAGFHEPASSLLQAIILGSANEIAPDIWDAFATSGLVHILSVSGFHVSVLFAVVTQVSVMLGLGMRAQTVVGVAFLASYLILLGAPAAAVRAAILGCAMSFARVAGRPANGMHILFVSAACMALANPLIVVWDIGFQFSFLAMLGIVLWQERIARTANFVPSIADVRSAVSMGTATYLCLVPALIGRYGYVSFVGVVATAAFGPLFSWLLVGTILYAALSSVPVIAEILRAPLYVLGSYLIEIARVSAEIPFVSLSVPEHLRLWVMIPWFTAIAFVALRGGKKRSQSKL